MSDQPRILAFAGSAREGSFNFKLVSVAAGHAEKAGAAVTLIDMNDHVLPLYGQGLQAESGMPPKAEALQKLFMEHDGFIISSPEHNSSISALMKNVIDWVSRTGTDGSTLEGFKGKTALLLSASPGGLGGLRGLVHLRSILGNIGVLVLPEQRAVSGAHAAFTDDGSLVDSRVDEGINAATGSLVQTTRKLKEG